MSEGKLEYQTVILDVRGGRRPLPEGPPVIGMGELNDYAAEGWRVVSMCLEVQTSGARPLVLMERERSS